MPTIMISLISEQAIPNVIAPLQYVPRPDRVICLVSADLRSSSETPIYDSEFKRAYQGVHDVLTELGMEVTATPPVHPYDLSEIMSACRKVREECDPEDRIVFNITGGTKLMALGVALVAKEQTPPNSVIYVDTERRCVIELQGERVIDYPFNEATLSEITVRRYLQSYGVSIQSSNPEVYPWQALEASRLILTHSEGRNVVSELRRLIDSETFRSGAYQLPRHTISDAGMELLQRFYEYGLFQEFEEGESALKITLTPHQREYFKEKWLTYYVYRTAKDINDQAGASLFTNCCFHGHLDWRGRPSKFDNEMDVVAVKAARLLLIECKTGGDPIKGSDILKLQVIGQKCGRYAEKLLVTTASRPVEAATGNFGETIRHALMAEVGIVGLEKLLDLASILKDVCGYIETQRRAAGI